MRYALILSVVLSISLAGCVTTQAPKQIKPAKPILSGISDHHGDPEGLCLDSRSLTDLMLYIEQLEHGYD